MRAKSPLIELKSIRNSSQDISILRSNRFFKHENQYYQLEKTTNGTTTFSLNCLHFKDRTEFEVTKTTPVDLGDVDSWADAERAAMTRIDASCISRDNSDSDAFVVRKSEKQPA